MYGLELLRYLNLKTDRGLGEGPGIPWQTPNAKHMTNFDQNTCVKHVGKMSSVNSTIYSSRASEKFQDEQKTHTVQEHLLFLSDVEIQPI